MKRNVIKLIRSNDRMIALCDDGTMWIGAVAGTGHLVWRRVDDVPQPNDDDREI